MDKCKSYCFSWEIKEIVPSCYAEREWGAEGRTMVLVVNLWLLRELSGEPSTRVLRPPGDLQKPHQKFLLFGTFRKNHPEMAIFGL